MKPPVKLTKVKKMIQDRNRKLKCGAEGCDQKARHQKITNIVKPEILEGDVCDKHWNHLQTNEQTKLLRRLATESRK